MTKTSGEAILKQIQLVNFNFFVIIKYKITTKILNRIRRKDKTAEIFFDIKKAYDKVNSEKTLEQLKNMGIQGRTMEFIRELIGESGRIYFTE